MKLFIFTKWKGVFQTLSDHLSVFLLYICPVSCPATAAGFVQGKKQVASLSSVEVFLVWALRVIVNMKLFKWKKIERSKALNCTTMFSWQWKTDSKWDGIKEKYKWWKDECFASAKKFENCVSRSQSVVNLTQQGDWALALLWLWNNRARCCKRDIKTWEKKQANYCADLRL